MSSHLQNAEKALCKQPILKYPDPERPYIVFTDAINYGWAGVLTQPYTDENDTSTQSHTIKADESNASNTNKADRTPQTIIHSVAYVSGLFREAT